MSRLVTIYNGIGRLSTQITNQTFPLLRDPEVKENGISIRVDGTGTKINHHNTKVMVRSENDFAIFEGEMPETVSSIIEEETDDTISGRIIETFDALREVSKGVADGVIRGLVIAGAPGVGKSYEVIKTVEDHGLVDKAELLENIGDDETDDMIDSLNLTNTRMYELVKGHITASSLYELLYRNRHENNTIIMDDIDAIFSDDKALNILKAALDTSSKRRLTWAVANGRADGVPCVFDFNGSIIFISNLDFEKMREKASVGKHIEAIMSRCIFLDMGIKTTREKVIRIKQVAINEGLFEQNGVTDPSLQNEIMEWMYDNADKFRELSLRTIVHLSNLCKMNNWKAIARQTLLSK